MPPTKACPPVGITRVVSTPTVVVLPAPLGPRSPKTSPVPTRRFSSSTARKSVPEVRLGQTDRLDDRRPPSGRRAVERRRGGRGRHGSICTVPGTTLSARPGRCSASASSASVRSVLGQDLVQLLAGLLDHGDATLDLRLLACARQLLGRAHELAHAEAERADLVVGLAVGLPGECGLLGLGPPGVGQRVGAAAIDLRRTGPCPRPRASGGAGRPTRGWGARGRRSSPPGGA